MQHDAVEPFPDNWTYLRAELNWLDRLLSLAVARQRQETKDTDRLARTRADKVTSHWWKGLVSLEGEVAGDSPAAMPKARSPKGSYQQQLESKIQASEQRSICLGIPTLKQRLHLTTIEKNLVLVVLAPEINRRYGRIYSYLQEAESSSKSGLPTVDLILRLLCRNDTEWRSLRQALTTNSALIEHHLLEIAPSQAESFLSRPVKLIDPLVSYLLSESPDTTVLNTLLAAAAAQPPGPSIPLVTLPPSPITWGDLVLPPDLVTALQHLGDRVRFASQVDDDWGFQAAMAPGQLACGSNVLLVGSKGTGKTLAAQAIAQSLDTLLVTVDLALLAPEEHERLRQYLTAQSPTVLLLKSAEAWLGRTTSLTDASIHQLFNWRRQNRGMTLFSTTQKQRVKPQWQQHMQPILTFPMPTASDRLKLWQRAFPAPVPLDAAIDWDQVSRLRLTGGEIRAIAREAAIYAAAASPDTKVTLQQLLQAYKGCCH